MELLIAYDVRTTDKAGRRRLRQVAKICEGFGQRVQLSVFECVVTEAQMVRLEARLAREIDPEADSLRIYRLREPLERFVTVLGRELEHDIHDALIL